MPTDPEYSSVSSRFFLPVVTALNQIASRRRCPVIDDPAWIMRGVTRALAPVRSGRDFLQSLTEDVCSHWGRSAYFEALKSTRRLESLKQLCNYISATIMSTALPDRLAVISQLDGYDVYAGDGHWHKHATHDPRRNRKDDSYAAVGHVFGLNLRTRALVHLAHCDERTKLKEHDMSVLKRIDREALRQGAPKGRKVIWIWDPAGINYVQWYKWKMSAGIYFLSRPKTNMITDHVAELPWDRNDPINAGVEQDGLLTEGPQTQIRIVVYRDPLSGEVYKFITNVMSLPPGIIAQLYKMRWDIEKSYDSFKNKLMETKAWATSPEAKTMQAMFMCLTLNLVTLMEHQIDLENDIRNEPEDRRREKRLQEDTERAQEAGKCLPSLQKMLSRATQTSVKFIRWLRYHLWRSTSWEAALLRLRRAYADL